MLATGFAIEMSFVAIGWQVYAVHSNPLDLGLVGLAMFIPLPLLALPGRPPGGSLPAPHAARDRDCARRRRHGRAALRHPGRSRFDMAVLRARVRHRSRIGARCSCLAGADAVARPARDPRTGARAAVDRVPGVRDRRACDRRPAVRGAFGARLRRCRGAVGPLARRVAVPPHRARFGRWVVTRPRERARRRPPRAPDTRAARRHLARPLRRPLRRRGRAAARSSRRTCSTSGRPASACSGRHLPSARCARRSSSPAGPWPARRPDAAHGRRPLRALDRRLRALARDVAFAARARRRRRRSTW